MLRISFQTNTALIAPLPELDAESGQKILAGVAAGNTGTRGVIEQRLTDCIALREAGDLTRWRLRGFGDSVFTTNTSQKKLGDAELKHATENRIVAVEAHGGRLTEKYVQDHLFTMRNVLPLRLEELEDRTPIGDWQLALQFFAHDLDAGLSEDHVVEGLPVHIIYRRFADVVEMPVDGDLLALLSTYFTEYLNAVHVHSRTGQAVLNLFDLHPADIRPPLRFISSGCLNQSGTTRLGYCSDLENTVMHRQHGPTTRAHGIQSIQCAHGLLAIQRLNLPQKFQLT